MGRATARGARARIVVTGLGVVSPVGNSVPAFWKGLVEGRCGIDRITLFDASTFPVRIGGEVRGLDFAALETAFPSVAGERDRKVWLALAAAREAIEDAELTPASLEQAALHVGVGLEELRLADAMSFAHGAEVTLSPQTPLDRTAELIADLFAICGGRQTNTSACAAGAQVVGAALRHLSHGMCEVAIAGATDSMLNPLGLGGFSLLRVLSAENDRPRSACRPFDATRQGTVLGEGAAFLVMETLEHALARGARIYAEPLGYGSSMDAFSVSDPEPSGKGAAAAMCKAIADAGLRADDIDCINAHATGTPKNDAVETAAIKQVFGARAYGIPVHAVKSMTGHMIAASGAVEAAAAVLTISERVIPPTVNLDRRDAECDLDYTPHRSREFRGRTVLSNSFGFGGQNAALVFARLEGHTGVSVRGGERAI